MRPRRVGRRRSCGGVVAASTRSVFSVRRSCRSCHLIRIQSTPLRTTPPAEWRLHRAGATLPATTPCGRIFASSRRGRRVSPVRHPGSAATSKGARAPALNSHCRLGPGRGAASSSQGRPHSIFKRAIQRRNVVVALAAARELPQVSLEDPLELALLVARKDPRRHPRAAAPWLLRYLEEEPAATVEEAALAASSLVALTGAGSRRPCRRCGPWPKGPPGDGGNEE